MHQFPEFQAALNKEGIVALLRLLNQRTPHRFTGVYRFANDQLVNLYLVDREFFDAPTRPTKPIADAYCAIVRATLAPVVLANSLDSHARQHQSNDDVVTSYCGVPLILPDGTPFGSLCHFDSRPILFSHVGLESLELAAPLLLSALLASDLPLP